MFNLFIFANDISWSNVCKYCTVRLLFGSFYKGELSFVHVAPVLNAIAFYLNLIVQSHEYELQRVCSLLRNV